MKIILLHNPVSPLARSGTRVKHQSPLLSNTSLTILVLDCPFLSGDFPEPRLRRPLGPPAVRVLIFQPAHEPPHPVIGLDLRLI